MRRGHMQSVLILHVGDNSCLSVRVQFTSPASVSWLQHTITCDSSQLSSHSSIRLSLLIVMGAHLYESSMRAALRASMRIAVSTVLNSRESLGSGNYRCEKIVPDFRKGPYLYFTGMPDRNVSKQDEISEKNLCYAVSCTFLYFQPVKIYVV